MVMILTKKFEFESSHRLINPQMDESWNKEKYGKCFEDKNGHGHRYVLEVSVIGEPDLETGMIINFVDLKKIVKGAVIEKFDHHFLNNVEELKGKITTCENIVREIWKMLKPKLSNLYSLKLFETSDACVTYIEPPKVRPIIMSPTHRPF